MLVKKFFIDFIVKIMLDNKGKVNIDFLLCNEIYLFTYDIKTTKPRQFPDPKMFHIDNF